MQEINQNTQMDFEIKTHYKKKTNLIRHLRKSKYVNVGYIDEMELQSVLTDEEFIETNDSVHHNECN
jgi:hypothetical protein